jgi:hypothetical protein
MTCKPNHCMMNEQTDARMRDACKPDCAVAQGRDHGTGNAARARREKCKRDGAAAGEQRQVQIRELMAENLALLRVIDAAPRQQRNGACPR